MKLTIKILAGVILSYGLVANAATAPDLGYMLGFKNANYDIDNVSTSSKPGVMLGVISVLDLGGIKLRTGGYYAERNSEIKGQSTTNDDVEVGLSYVDVPVTLYFGNESFGFFAGAVAAMKLNDSVKTSSGTFELEDVSSVHFAGTAGMRAVFGPNWAGELSYEMGLNDLAKDVEASAVSLNLQFIY